jgi:hypothetical protein
VTVNKERVKLLVDALRSGEFQQAKGTLRTPDERYHCCLGVATEVALRNGVVVDEKNQGFPWRQTAQIMCAEIYEWYGFESGNPNLKGMTTSAAASHWNDDFDRSFLDIADGFERTYLDPNEAAAAVW